MGLLDLVALATVCDVMPLIGVNRALVAQGLRVMARRERPGIAALLAIAQKQGHPTAMTCGYGWGRGSTPPAASPRPIWACACCCAATRSRLPPWPNAWTR